MPPATPQTTWSRVVALAVAASAIVIVVVLAFLWPTITSTVKDLPIGVAGDSAQVGTFTDALEQNAAGRFDIVDTADRAEAVSKIERREIYGAVILGETPEVLTASAGGAVPTQVMGQLAAQLQAQIDAAVSPGHRPPSRRPPPPCRRGSSPPSRLCK
ncbi:hypothetical protein [Microterricola viridarii]|uniref:Uncharacterized protein n=1 Tax=Microterricola viridarii TaxID=412690 RepID=A0A1H1Y6K7_9MICO|nr:hypothetical protein [Microterricola viridarii]SDT17012.1 hypothetical protein SAMN04489834_2991 [Microterricola viridarii]